MVKKIRRVKITVREKELIIVKSGTGQKENSANMQLTVCPLCHSPLHLLANNSPLELSELNNTPLLHEGDDLEGERQ